MLDTGSFLTIFSIKAVVIKNDKKPPVAEIRAVAKIDINESFFSYFYTLALRVLWDFLSVYYTICLPIIKYISGGKNDETFLERIVGISKDHFVRAAVAALTCGLFLNVSDISRPLFFENIIGFFVPVGTFILLVSIGLGMRFSSVGDYIVEGLAVSLVKFIAVPFISVTIAYLFGFGSINDGLPLKVVLIASSMPIAFVGLVVASVYDLDLDLVNSCWLITTGALVIVVPWLYFLLTIM